ncbi:MAG: hypothetical protein V3U76_00275 [Granulosicoccus sp.]
MSDETAVITLTVFSDPYYYQLLFNDRSEDAQAQIPEVAKYPD